MHLLTFIILLGIYAISKGFNELFSGTNEPSEDIWRRAVRNGDVVYHVGKKTYLTKDCMPVTFYSKGNGDWGYKYSNGTIAYSKQEELKQEEIKKATDLGWRTTYKCTDPGIRERYAPYQGTVYRDLKANCNYFVRSVMCCRHDPVKQMIVESVMVCCYFSANTHRIVRLSDGEINHRAWLKKYTPDAWYPNDEEIQEAINYFNQKMNEKEHGDKYAPSYIWVKNYGEEEYKYPNDRVEVNHPFHQIAESAS